MDTISPLDHRTAPQLTCLRTEDNEKHYTSAPLTVSLDYGKHYQGTASAKALSAPRLRRVYVAPLLETSQGRSSHGFDENMLSMSPLAKKKDSEVKKGHPGATALASTLEFVASERNGAVVFELHTQREATEW